MNDEVVFDGETYTPFDIISIRVNGQCSCQMIEIISDLKDLFEMTDEQATETFEQWKKRTD